MRPVGVLRPDHGPGYAECQCSLCGATAVAIISESCAWCERSLDRQIGWQRDILLNPQLPDQHDETWSGSMRGWAERLANAVKAEIITADEARRAWKRRFRERAA